MLKYYDYNVKNALLHLFPDIGLDESRFLFSTALIDLFDNTNYLNRKNKS